MTIRLLILLFIPLASCGQKNTSLDEEVKTLYKNTVPVITKADAEKTTNAKILDTRELEEFNISHIPNAQMVGYDNFDLASVASIPKNDTIIVYCSVGYRSERIGEKLLDAGFTHVFNLYGGIFNWKNHNGVVLDASNDTTERVHTYNKSWSRFLSEGEKVY